MPTASSHLQNCGESDLDASENFLIFCSWHGTHRAAREVKAAVSIQRNLCKRKSAVPVLKLFSVIYACRVRVGAGPGRSHVVLMQYGTSSLLVKQEKQFMRRKQWQVAACSVDTRAVF